MYHYLLHSGKKASNVWAFLIAKSVAKNSWGKPFVLVKVLYAKRCNLYEASSFLSCLTESGLRVTGSLTRPLHVPYLIGLPYSYTTPFGEGRVVGVQHLNK